MKRRLALILTLVLLILNSIGTTNSLAYSSDSYTWKNVAINGGGFVTGLVYSPLQNGLLYARTDVGGCYRFDSETKTWTPLMDFIGKTDADDMGVLSIALDPTDVNKLYIMTGLYTSQWAGNGNFYASNDKGATWTKTALPFKVGGNENGRNTGERLQVDPNLPSVLYMGSTTDGLYKSTNYGKTWNKVTAFSGQNINFVLLDSSSSSSGTATKRIIVGTKDTSNSMYISNDGGSTWNTIVGQPSGYCPIRADVAEGTMFVTYSAFSNSSDMPGPGGASSGVIYNYNISTSTWTNITPTGEGKYFGFGGISIDKQNSKHIIVATLDRWWPSDEIFQSFDGGSTWTKIFSTGTHTETKAPYARDNCIGWISDIKIDPFNSNKAIFSHGGGVYMTEGLTDSKVVWSYENSGLEETCPQELKSPSSGTNLFSALGDVGAFKHDDLTTSPKDELTPVGGTNWSIDFAELAQNKLVRSYSNKTSTSYGAYSTDGGTTWSEFASAPSNTGCGGYIAISADGSKIVWTPRNTSWNYMTPYVSTDNGSTWNTSSGGVAGMKPVADRVNSSKFYQFDYENGKVYVSTDGGASFTVGARNLPAVPSYLPNNADMKAVFGKEGHLWATTGSGGLYYSTDSGQSFSKLSTVTEAYKIGFGKATSIGGYPAIFISGIVDGNYGFFRSDDQGASWVRINDSAHQYNNIGDITGDPKVYGRIYIAAGGRGIIYGDLSSTPTASPTVTPTVAPTVAPTASPTASPTVAPTVAPTASPTVAPTASPTVAPTASPTVAPTVIPTVTPTTKGVVPVVKVTTTNNGNSINQKYTITTNGGTLDLSKLSLYYTATGMSTDTQNVWVDNAALQLNIAPWYASLTSAITGNISNGKIKISCSSSTTLAEGTGYLTIDLRFAKNDWSTYGTLSNECITVYYNGQLVQ